LAGEVGGVRGRGEGGGVRGRGGVVAGWVAGMARSYAGAVT